MRAICLIALALAASAREAEPPASSSSRRSPADAELMAGGSCEQRPATPGASSPQLQLVRLAPSSGSVVDRQTLLLASVSYDLPAYREGQYRLTAQFDTNEAGVTVDGVFRGGLNVLACGPSGTFSFALPLESVFRYSGIRRPLRFRFYLLEGAGKTLEVVASSGVVEYSEP